MGKAAAVVVGEDILDTPLCSTFAAGLPPSGIEQVGMVLHEGGADARVAQQEVAEFFREDVVRPHRITRFAGKIRSVEHTSELMSLMHPSYAVFCLKKKK